MRFAVSNPSMPGMLTSSVVTSGECSRTSSSPSSPVPAPCTVNPACASTADSSDRMSSSSSITTATRASSTVAPSGAGETIAGARTSVMISQKAVWNLRSGSLMSAGPGRRARVRAVGWRSPPRSPSHHTDDRGMGGRHAVASTSHRTPSLRHCPRSLFHRVVPDDTAADSGPAQVALKNGQSSGRGILDSCHSSHSPEASPRESPRSRAVSRSTEPSSSTPTRSSATSSSRGRPSSPRSPPISATGCCCPTDRSIVRHSARACSAMPPR